MDNHRLNYEKAYKLTEDIFLVVYLKAKVIRSFAKVIES